MDDIKKWREEFLEYVSGLNLPRDDYRGFVGYLEEVPSAEPDDAALHESCTDCPLYDHDKHRCPRFNKVIPTTIQEILDTQTQKWIPVTERLPVEGESVLLCNSYGDMTLGRLVRTNEGCNWDIYAWWCDIYDWVAWMPLPEPYREVTK